MNPNEHLHTGRYGQKLILQWEGKFRTKARKCEGGRYELGPGCTTWPPNGRPVGPADTATPDQCLQLFAWHLIEKENIVKKHVKVLLNQHQFDAHVAAVYNIGEGNYTDGPDGQCTFLRETNNKNWHAAAEAFGRFVYATSDGPSDKQIKIAKLKPIIGTHPKTGEPCWLSPPDANGDRHPCDYRQALLGLLRRHYSEGLLFLSLPWEEAVDEDQTSLEEERHWIESRDRYEDTVPECTPFSTVLKRAEKLGIKLVLDVPPVAPAQKPPAAVAPSPVPAAKPAPAPVPAKTAAPKPPAIAKPQAPVPAAKETVDVAFADIGKIRVDNGAKVMETSDRAVAVGLKLGGIGVKKFVEHRVVPSWVGGVYFDVVTDPVLVAMITLGIVALWTWGHAMLVAGRRKRAKHALTASTLVY